MSSDDSILLMQHWQNFVCANHIGMCTAYKSMYILQCCKQEHVSCLVSSTPKIFKLLNEGEICCLFIVTFGEKVDFCNSSPVYWSQLYGNTYIFSSLQLHNWGNNNWRPYPFDWNEKPMPSTFQWISHCENLHYCHNQRSFQRRIKWGQKGGSEPNQVQRMEKTKKYFQRSNET